MNVTQQFYDLFPSEILGNPHVTDALNNMELHPRMPRYWAVLAKELTTAGALFTTRSLLEMAVVQSPTWKAARIARARWAAGVAEVEILSADLMWLEQQNLPTKITAPLALKHAILTRNETRIEQLVDELSKAALGKTDVLTPKLLLEDCCQIADLTTVLKLLEHDARIDPSQVRLSFCVRRFFTLGKSTQAKKLLDWAASHPDLKDQGEKSLRVSRLNLLKSQEYLYRTLTIAGIDPKTSSEAQACAVDLVSARTFAKGGVEVERIVSIYDAIFAGDWRGSASLIDLLSSSTALTAKVRENLDLMSEMIGKIVSSPPPNRPTLSNISRYDEVTFSPVGDTTKTALMFGNFRFGLRFPVALLDRLLAEAGYNCIFLEDSSALSGSAGYSELGPTAKASANALRNELDARGCNNPLVIGASAGGLGALNYGLELGAERIVVISGGTMGASEDMKAVKDKRVPQLSALFDTIDPIDNFKRPIRDVLADVDAPPPIRMVFPELNRADRAQAEDIASFPNVRLTPIIGARKHLTIWPFFAQSGPEGLLD